MMKVMNGRKGTSRNWEGVGLHYRLGDDMFSDLPTSYLLGADITGTDNLRGRVDDGGYERKGTWPNS